MYIDPGVRNFVLLCLAVIIVVGAVVWNLLPDPGVREFQRANEALKKVKSWRLKDTDRGTYFTQEKVTDTVCPGSQHSTSQTLKYDGTSSNQFESYYAGGTGYVFNGSMNSWEAKDEWTGPETICTKIGLGLDVLPFPQFLRLSKMAQIRKGELKTVDGVSCRMWFAKMPILGQFNENEEVCIAPDTHLPVERKSHYAVGLYTFSNWNEPFDIQAPIAPADSTPKSARDAFAEEERRSRRRNY